MTNEEYCLCLVCMIDVCLFRIKYIVPELYFFYYIFFNNDFFYFLFQIEWHCSAKSPAIILYYKLLYSYTKVNRASLPTHTLLKMIVELFIFIEFVDEKIILIRVNIISK